MSAAYPSPEKKRNMATRSAEGTSPSGSEGDTWVTTRRKGMSVDTFGRDAGLGHD